MSSDAETEGMKSLALYPRGCLRPSLINGLFLYTFNDTLALFLSRFRDSEGLDPSVASGRSIGERGWVSSKVGRGPWQGRLCHSYQFSHLLFTKVNDSSNSGRVVYPSGSSRSCPPGNWSVVQVHQWLDGRSDGKGRGTPRVCGVREC